MNWGDAPTWVGAGVALVSAAVAIWQTKGAKDAKTAAARSATEAAADARRTADASERLAAAQEETAALMRAEAESNSQRWAIEHDRGGLWLVRNETGVKAFGVVLSSPPENHLINRFTDVPEDLSPGEAMQFFASETNETTDNRITITWYRAPDRAGDPLTFRFPLTGRPR